uniref:Palmitoyl-protein thioesterase 1 n=1 Tax=Favella ehrenbergii TaxID=182087 RepID=A0A7S3MKV0_9SPIT|eukprot:Macronucleus_1438.p1 GENE.Macronucleus_1438~~Macronucleus_1438.p1  ORF type:complete len:280 (+),score=140.62 Macronucleus_1438:52-840(+)
MGDACIYPGMHHFSKEIGEGTGDYAKCLEVGNGSITSLTDNFMDQAEKACNKLLADENFAVDEINVMGLSQGALLARYIVESCPIKGKVRNLASIGGPNMGVMDIPHCFSGPFCKVINSIARDFVYTGIIQNIVGPAGYFRDPYHMDRYLNGSVFLPHLNNEEDDDATKADRKARFTSLNGAMLMMFSQDTMVYPKESEWFQQIGPDGTVQALEDSDFYKNDYLGLKTLNEANKVQFVSVDGDHLQFSQDDINNTIIPFLLS